MTKTDRRLQAVGAHSGKNRPTVKLRKYDIQDGDIVSPLDCEFEPGLSAIGQVDNEAIFAKSLAQMATLFSLIFNDQNSHCDKVSQKTAITPVAN